MMIAENSEQMKTSIVARRKFRLACYLPLSVGDHRCYRHQDFERSWHCESPALLSCPASDKEKVFMCNLSGERWRKYQPFRLTSLPIRRGITPPNRSLSERGDTKRSFCVSCVCRTTNCNPSSPIKLSPCNGSHPSRHRLDTPSGPKNDLTKFDRLKKL